MAVDWAPRFRVSGGGPPALHWDVAVRGLVTWLQVFGTAVRGEFQGWRAIEVRQDKAYAPLKGFFWNGALELGRWLRIIQALLFLCEIVELLFSSSMLEEIVEISTFLS